MHARSRCARHPPVRAPRINLCRRLDGEYGGALCATEGRRYAFRLDPLWAHPDIDAIGIDYYPPISDWRDGSDHLDAGIARSAYDLDYLCDRLGAGEAFDWYYADAADRAAQNPSLRSLTGSIGKPLDLSRQGSGRLVEQCAC